MIIDDELLLSAAEIVEKGCAERECEDCKIQCYDYFSLETKTPDKWEMSRRQRLNKKIKDNMRNTIEIPFLIGNTIVYIRHGKPKMLTCGDKKQAEEALEEIRKEG